LFTFSSKVIKSFIKKKFHNSITEHLNVQKRRNQSKKAKIRAPTGYDPRTSG
jgi:hypothetical protein